MSDASSSNKQELAEDRTEEATERTDLAEDRTLLANERTFAGWCRTSLACVGVGLGFQAIFKDMEPTWVAKAIATVLISLGIYVIWQAERRASRLRGRKSENEVSLMRPENFRTMAVAITCSAILLIIGIWAFI